MTDLVKHTATEIDAPISNGEMDTLYRLANGLSQSGFFKDAKQAQQAFAKLIFGRDLGLSATQAMTDIHIVEGKPEMSANLQAAKVKQSGRYDYRIDELTNEVCRVRFLQEGQEVGVSEFTIQDAVKAGLAGKNNWKHYPRNMLFARAMSNGVAWFCPDVMAGIRVYAEDEVREHFPAEPEPEPEQQPQVEPPIVSEADAEALRRAIEVAGLTEDEVRMELVGQGVDDASDIDRALCCLSVEQADALTQRVAERFEPEPVDAEVAA